MNKIAIASAGVITAGLLAMVAGTSMAATSNNSGDDSLVAKIAKQFNLNQQDVQKVFDQNRADHQAARQAKISADLTQAVTDGKITADQKAKLLAKINEFQNQREANHEAFKDKTPAERRTLMEQNRAAIDKWLSDNGIPADFMRYLFGGHGHGFGFHGDLMNDTAPTSSSNTN